MRSGGLHLLPVYSALTLSLAINMSWHCLMSQGDLLSIAYQSWCYRIHWWAITASSVKSYLYGLFSNPSMADLDSVKMVIFCMLRGHLKIIDPTDLNPNFIAIISASKCEHTFPHASKGWTQIVTASCVKLQTAVEQWLAHLPSGHTFKFSSRGEFNFHLLGSKIDAP